MPDPDLSGLDPDEAEVVARAMAAFEPSASAVSPPRKMVAPRQPANPSTSTAAAAPPGPSSSSTSSADPPAPDASGRHSTGDPATTSPERRTMSDVFDDLAAEGSEEKKKLKKNPGLIENIVLGFIAGIKKKLPGQVKVVTVTVDGVTFPKGSTAATPLDADAAKFVKFANNSDDSVKMTNLDIIAFLQKEHGVDEKVAKTAVDKAINAIKGVK